jgi:hypothetical protein
MDNYEKNKIHRNTNCKKCVQAVNTKKVSSFRSSTSAMGVDVMLAAQTYKCPKITS